MTYAMNLSRPTGYEYEDSDPDARYNNNLSHKNVTLVVYDCTQWSRCSHIYHKHKADRRSRPSLLKKTEPVFAVKLSVIASYINCLICLKTLKERRFGEERG